MTWDTVSLSQNALDLAKKQQSSLISIMENASTGQTPAERSADGRRAAMAMQAERDADDIKRGTLVIEDNQEAYEENIEDAKTDREEANNSTNTSTDTTSESTSSSSSSGSSSESANAPEPSESTETSA